MDSVALLSASSLPLAGALASLVALPFLGLESTRATSPERAARDAVATASATDAPSHAVRFVARDLEAGRELASEPRAGSGSVESSRDLVVAAAAFARLKPEYRFRTFYATRGRVSEETLWGDLVVGGRGDPTVDTIRLREVANKVAHAGILRITGAILLDDSFFRTGDLEDEVTMVDEEGTASPPLDGGVVDEPEPPAEALDVPSTPGSTGAFPFHGNTVTLVARPSALGAPLVVDVDVPGSATVVRNLARTAPFARRLRAIPVFTDERATILLSGALAPDDDAVRLVVRLPDGAYTFGATLADELRRRGVKTTGRVRAVDAGGRRRWLLTDFSPPLGDVLARMVRKRGPGEPTIHLDAVLRVLAAEAFAQDGVRTHGLATVRAFLEHDVGIKGDDVVLEPERTVLPPHAVVEVLAFVRRVFELSSEFEAALGPATLHPVLKHRLDPALLPRVRAAATVDDTHADVSGYLTRKDGHPVAFSLQLEAADPARPTTTDALWADVNRRLLALVEPSSFDAARSTKRPPRESRR